MTQSQTSAFISFPYGGASNGLSIHEREREAARIERERQLQNAEVSLSLPLFPQGPRKVQPSHGDRLQHNIQATLGDFNALAPSMSHQKQYSLLGITNKVPQTPVDAANNKVFCFENNLAAKKENNAVDKNGLKNPKVKSQIRTKDDRLKNDKITINKKTLNTEQYLKNLKSNKKPSEEGQSNSKENILKKASQESSGSNTIKQESEELSNNSHKITSVKKEPKDTPLKLKPPKLSIKTRSPEHTVAANESTQPNVKKILEEMTQPGPPPLTAIQTPRKNNAQFAFPYNPVASAIPKEEQILEDLHISEDENTDDEANGSSDDSDSSSDSDSDSSTDHSAPNSPVHSKLNKPGKTDKTKLISNEEVKKNNLLSETPVSTTSSLADTGEGGIRGDIIAPGVNTSPLNNPLLSTDNTTNELSIFEEFGFELPEISKNIFEDIGNGNVSETNGFHDALLESDIALGDNHFKPIEKPSEIKLKHPEVNISSKENKKVKTDEVSTKVKQQAKEKSSKPLNKKQVLDHVKPSSNIGKVDSKSKKNELTTEKKAVKQRKVSTSSKTTKSSVSDAENEEIIDVVTVTTNDKPLLNGKSNSVETKDNKTNETSKPSTKTKTAEKQEQKTENLVNGHSKSGQEHTKSNGKIELLQKHDSLDDEITLDCNAKPDALVVKIPLALLKRIPLLKSIGSRLDCESSPPRKIPKHNMSVECSDGKKSRQDNPVNGKSKERHPSSTTSDDYRPSKRSPSKENDRYYNKRRRCDSEGSQNEKETDKSKKMNGWDKKKEAKMPQEHCQDCNGKAGNEQWIESLYRTEPRVPHGQEHYLREAKRVKHRADAMKDPLSKAYKYFESILNFVNCCKALEQNHDSESRSACQMYYETIEMLKYAMRLTSSKSSQEKKCDKRFIGLCLRLQALLYMRLFKLKKDSMLKASKTLMDHFKGQPKTSQASPYNNTSNPKTTGTPSPMSPTPSPSGSIGSVGSVGSAGSNETMTTPSRTTNKPCMTSPVNTCIPQKTHSLTLQHLNYTNYMLYGYDSWEQSQNIFNDFKEFFMELDRNYGPITLHSSIVDVVEYVHQGYLRLQDT